MGFDGTGATHNKLDPRAPTHYPLPMNKKEIYRNAQLIIERLKENDLGLVVSTDDPLGGYIIFDDSTPGYWELRKAMAAEFSRLKRDADAPESPDV